jgi:hypothetical protein
MCGRLMRRHDAEDNVCDRPACRIAEEKLGQSRWRQQHGRQKVLRDWRRRCARAKRAGIILAVDRGMLKYEVAL